MRNGLAELKYFLRRFVDEFVVDVAADIVVTVSILVALGAALYVPQSHRGIIRRDNRLAVRALRQRIDVEVMHICESLLKFNRTFVN